MKIVLGRTAQFVVLSPLVVLMGLQTACQWTVQFCDWLAKGRWVTHALVGVADRIETWASK